MPDFQPASAQGPTAAAQPTGPEPSKPTAGKHYVQHEGVMYALRPAGYRKLLKVLKPGVALELSAYGTKLGEVLDLAGLLERAQERAADDRRKTTGRFPTRAKLLEAVWSLRLCSQLSDSAIADNVEITPTSLTRIFATQEGRPEGAPVAQGFRARRFRGR